MCSLKKQLKESQENQSNTDVKVNNLLANIRTLQEDRKSLEAKLTQKQSAYQAQVYLFIHISHTFYTYKKTLIFIYLQLDVLQQKTEECEQLCEKLTILELKMSTESDEKSQYEVLFERDIHNCYNFSKYVTFYTYM